MTESPGSAPKQPVPDEARERQPRRWRMGAFGGAVAGALLLAGLLVGSDPGDRAVSNVRLESEDVSHLSHAEIVARAEAWGAARGQSKIPLSLAGQTLVFEPEMVGFKIDGESTARRVLSIGRDGSSVRRVTGWVERWLRPEHVAVVFSIDPARLSTLEDAWEAQSISDGPFPGGISIDGAMVTPLYPRAGRRLDRARVLTQITTAVRLGSAPEPLATRNESLRVSSAEVDRVATLARGLLSAEVRLTTPDLAHHLDLTPAQLGALLQVRGTPTEAALGLACSAAAMHEFLGPYRAELEQPMRDARFVVDDRDQVRIEPGQAAVVVDDQALADAACKAAESTEKKAELPLGVGAQPTLSTEAAEQAGVTGLVGSYTTRHACCQPRVQNIHHIADLLDGTLVRAGDTFSVNQLVGPRTVKNGFRPAPSIEDGDMVDTVGGGVSQFATTLFNALFYAGYDILERQPHSYWFTRYPMGYDATLSYPHPDIVFKNDTDAAALIKTSYTDTTITVKVYGNNGGRRVRAEVSERQNIVPPPVELIPNPHLDADEEKTREGGMIGWTVTVKRILTFRDGKTKEERRKVTYKPRARRVEVHPCRIPKGEPGYTGERCPIAPKAADEASEPTDAGAK